MDASHFLFISNYSPRFRVENLAKFGVVFFANIKSDHFAFASFDCSSKTSHRTSETNKLHFNTSRTGLLFCYSQPFLYYFNWLVQLKLDIFYKAMLVTLSQFKNAIYGKCSRKMTTTHSFLVNSFTNSTLHNLSFMLKRFARHLVWLVGQRKTSFLLAIKKWISNEKTFEARRKKKLWKVG